jgi:putative endonuclease
MEKDGDQRKALGFYGETLAKNFLLARGYSFICANVRFGRLEIDLVTKYGNLTVFIEVKTRRSSGVSLAEDSLKLSQIKDLKRAIRIYCGKNRINPNMVRLDFISIDLNQQKSTAKIKHFKDIF